MEIDRAIKVLIVDDDAVLRQMISTVLSLSQACKFISTGAGSSEEALKVAEEFDPDVVLMDLTMPGPDGDVVTRKLLKKNPRFKVIAHTGHVDSEAITKMLVAGAVGYVVKGGETLELIHIIRDVYLGKRPIDAQAMPGLMEGMINLARQEQKRRREAEKLHEELENTYSEVVLGLAEALRTRDNETQDHVDRVVAYSKGIAKKMGLSKDQICLVERGAMFHDIGKLGVPDSILLNKDQLTPDEWTVIKQHTIVGEKILKPISYLERAGEIVRSTHENWDGTGYPDQLSHNDIPLEARIIRVADSFDAMTSRRRYQPTQEMQGAYDKLKELAGTIFDPDVVRALGEYLEDLA